MPNQCKSDFTLRSVNLNLRQLKKATDNQKNFVAFLTFYLSLGKSSNDISSS